MAIPQTDENGWLPGGVYDCSLDQVAARFGNFQGSDRRPILWARFSEFIRVARASGLVQSILLDGSFVSAKSDPNDIDLIVVVALTHDFSADLPPFQYNILDQKGVRKRFGFDIVVVKNESSNLDLVIAFFQQVKQRPGLRKGILRLLI